MPRGIPVIIVEGHLEHIFIRENCGTRIKVLKLSNGDSVSPGALAKQIYYQLAALSVQPSYVAILADRESRTEESIDLENLITQALGTYKVTLPFSVHVPDKMIENWIIADSEVLEKEKLELGLVCGTEGCNGKAKLKQAFKNNNRKYSETEDGPRLLRRCSASKIRHVSPSFARFHSALAQAIPECHWLNK